MSKETFEEWWSEIYASVNHIRPDEVWNHQQKKIDELEERHRLQLAGIMTLSVCNTEKSLSEQMIPDSNPYWTVALNDVKVAMEREIKLIKENKELRELLREGCKIIDVNLMCSCCGMICIKHDFIDRPEVKALLERNKV